MRKSIRRCSKPHCPCFVRRSRTKRTYNAKGCEATNEAKLRVLPSPPKRKPPIWRFFFLRKSIRRYSKPHCPCFVRCSRTKRTYNAKGCVATNEAKLRVPPSPPRQNKLHLVCDGRFITVWQSLLPPKRNTAN